MLRLVLPALCFAAPAFAADESISVTIRVDAAKTHGELKPIYRLFGADDPNYAYMKDGQKLPHDILPHECFALTGL